jgi:hypothetical protein
MKELNLITARHADGREVQFAQFDKIAIGRPLTSGEPAILHFAFRTHPDTATEYIKLDALLRELGFEEIERITVSIEHIKNFNELLFDLYKAYSEDAECTVFEFERVTIVAADDGIQVCIDCEMSEILGMYFYDDYDVYECFDIDLAPNETTALALRFVDLENTLHNWLRDTGEVFEDDDHAALLVQAMAIVDAIASGEIGDHITDLLDELNYIADEVDNADDADKLATMICEVKAFRTDCNEFLTAQRRDVTSEVDKNDNA